MALSLTQRRLDRVAVPARGAGRVCPRTGRSAVCYVEDLPADLLAFALDWESQSVTRADSETGPRYQEHARRGSHVLLFARLDTDERAFHFLGPARYVRQESEHPMAITWKLENRLQGDLYQAFAAAVA